MKKLLKALIISIIVLLFFGCVTLFVISYCVDGTFDYCDSNVEAKKIFEQRIEHINTLLENGNISKLKEEDTSTTNDYYFQEYNILGDNEEMTIAMICNHNALEYNFSWEKYDESVNFEYTEQEIERVTEILNSISKKKFSSEEIYEFINAEEDKYNPEKYGLNKIKYATLDKIKYINAFTKYAAFEHTVWNENNGYSSLFSINGKFIKELENK